MSFQLANDSQMFFFYKISQAMRKLFILSKMKKEIEGLILTNQIYAIKKVYVNYLIQSVH